MHRFVLATTAALLLLTAESATAQPSSPPVPPPPPPPPPGADGLTVRDSSVGYIDSPSPADLARIRADYGFGLRVPNRAEFFYAQGQPNGPGVPRPERNIDFQDYSLYLEKTIDPVWSVFAEGGIRYLDPQVNVNATGWSDVNLGLKYAFLSNETSLATFQVRAYAPTGETDRGLGTGHVTLEPALLGFTRLNEDLGLAAEARYWQPIDGTSFAGGVIRYGLGLRYDVWREDQFRLTPTAEAIGWSVVGGRQSQVFPNDMAIATSAAGINVVNLKLGARLDLSEQAGLYAGYGWAVTGERWYADIVRVEFRWLF